MKWIMQDTNRKVTWSDQSKALKFRNFDFVVPTSYIGCSPIRGFYFITFQKRMGLKFQNVQKVIFENIHYLPLSSKQCF